MQPRNGTEALVELRILTPADAGPFWELRLRGFRDDPEAFGSTAEDHQARTLADVERELGLGSDHHVIGAFDGTALAGILGFDREQRVKRRHRANLWGMYVDRAARGRGIGAALIDDMVARSRRVPGLEQLILTVMASNGSARRLYERAGFRVYGRAPRAMLMGAQAFDEDLMWLDLR